MPEVFGSGSSGFSWAQSSAPTEQDFGAQIEGGLAKIAAQHPLLGERMRAAYESREPYSTNFLSGAISWITGKGKGLAGGLVEGLGNISTAFSRPFMDEEDQADWRPDDILSDMWQGLTGKENTYWKDNLKSYGMGDSWTTTVLGTALDIFADPTTYLGSGALGVGKETVALTAKELGEHGARQIITKEATEQGFRLGAKTIKYEDEFLPTIASMSREQLINQGVHADLVDALAGIAAHTGERKILSSVDDLVQKEVEEIGMLVADTIFRKRNLQALPKTFTTQSGRTWTRGEIQRIFKEAGRMNKEQVADLANKLYGGSPTVLQQAQVGRYAAAAMGGVRLKFGLPFGNRIAQRTENPFWAYRWQTNAMSTRWDIAGKEFGVTDLGNFFRGTSGLHKLENAIGSSLANGDGMWDREALSVFLNSEQGGFGGLKHYMYARDVDVPGSREAFDQVFGTRASSILMPFSERAGGFTAALTSGAESWRRNGYMGWRAHTLGRTAKNRQKEFRQWASREYVEKWAVVATRLQDDARKHDSRWLQDVYDNMIKYIEGTDDAAKTALPDYLQKVADEIGPAFANMHATLTGRYGVDIGDLTEVFARNKHTQALKQLNKRRSDINRKLDKLKQNAVGDKVAREALEAEQAALTKQIEELDAQTEDITKIVSSMDEYDNLIRLYAPELVSSKASPKQYFHRRFTSEARAALVGSFKAQTKTYSKAKLRTAELERKLASLNFREAEEAIRKEYGDVLRGKKIFEDNPFQVIAHYIEDMGEAVLKAELNAGFKYLTKNLGAVDNGSVTKLVTEMVDPEWMPTAYRSMLKQMQNLDEVGDLTTRKEVANWIKDFEEKLGVVGAATPASKTEPWHFTKKEWFRKQVKEAAKGRPESIEVGEEITESGIILKRTTPEGKKVNESAIELQHRRFVMDALDRGEKVPFEVIKDYPEIAEALVRVPKNIQNNPDELRKLQSIMQSLNRIKTRSQGIEAFPEPAMKEIEIGMDMSKWGRLDVPGLENYAMHPFMAAEFNRYWNNANGNISWMQQQWRKFVMGPWKEWATVYWPGFHVRNFMGAWFNSELGGVTRTHYKLMNNLSDVASKGEKSAWWGKPIRRMKIDGEVRTLVYGGARRGTDEVNALDMMEDLGILNNGGLALADLRTYLSNRDFLSLDTGHKISRKMKITGKFKTDRWGEVTGAEYLTRRWKQWGVNRTANVENYFRGATFLKGLEDSSDTAAARAFTMMRHGDYDELTDLENVIKDFIPFYKWMRTNIPFQLRNMIENPGKQLATMDIGRGLVDEDTRKELAPWMRNSLMVHLPWTKKISGVEGTDEAAAFLMAELPLENIFINTNEFFSSFLPVLRPILIENNVFKQSSFTGAPLEGGSAKETLLGQVPGVGSVLKAVGIVEEGPDGKTYMNDRWQNALAVLPMYSRARPFLNAEDDRVETRTRGFLSVLAGVSFQDVDAEDLNNAEADWLFNNLKPQMDKMRDMGYEFPDARTWNWIGNHSQGLVPGGEGPKVGG